MYILCPSALFKNQAVSDWAGDYIKRIKTPVHIPDITVKTKPSDTPDMVKQKQADAICKTLQSLPQNTAVIALDERGKTLSSPDFATQVGQFENQGYSSFAFIIGGAYGLAQDILNKADFKLSFGSMVWPHRLVGVMLLEQLYRAQQIRSGHPYHKD